jgi:hypothetical protein
MSKRAWSSHWVPALAITAVSIAAIAAATFGARETPAPVAATRPAADAAVDVVRAPASAVTVREPACPTCTLGAGKEWL